MLCCAFGASVGHILSRIIAIIFAIGDRSDRRDLFADEIFLIFIVIFIVLFYFVLSVFNEYLFLCGFHFIKQVLMQQTLARSLLVYHMNIYYVCTRVQSGPFSNIRAQLNNCALIFENKNIVMTGRIKISLCSIKKLKSKKPKNFIRDKSSIITQTHFG